MIISINLVEDRLDELEKRFKMLKDQAVEVGAFGTEEHYSGFTYPSLLKYMADGNDDMNLPPRDVLSLCFMFNPVAKNKQLKKDLKEYFKNIRKDKSREDVNKILTNLGVHYSNKVKDLFGDSSVLTPNAPSTVAWKQSMGYIGQAPLLRTGDLMDSIEYKINYTE